MSFDTRLSPARVSAAAAREFPRWALFALLVAYIAAGLFGRDPWYAEDAAGIGIIASMLHGEPSSWWLPNIAGEWQVDEGPLPFWVGAAFAWLLGPMLGEAQAARLSCVLWFTLATTALWYATYRLARRPEAQPVSFAFGGEAQPRDYGRMVADIALLLFLGTIGLVLRLHEVTAETAAFAFVSTALFGLVLALDAPVRGALVAGVSIGALALSRGPVPAAVVLLASVGALWIALPDPARRLGALITVIVACLVALVWPIGVQGMPEALQNDFAAAWTASLAQAIGLPRLVDLTWFPRNLSWYGWPLWPLAIWTAYAWRHGLKSPHIAIPGLLLILPLVALVFQRPLTESGLVLLVPPLVLLAAFGATSLRRSLDTLIDWFAMAIFSLSALAAWLYFMAMMTGTPPRMSERLFRLVPGFEPAWQPVPLMIAAGVTVGWIAFVLWRVLRRPPMLWRGPALAACGLVMLWLLAVTLFLPAVNYNRSYAPIAAQIRAQVDQLAPGSCLETHQLAAAHKAALAYHGGLRFAAPNAGDDCALLLQRDSRRTQLDDGPPPGDWAAVWEGTWPARPDEVLRLYRRSG